MKNLSLFLVFFLTSWTVFADDTKAHQIDSLKQVLSTAKTDSVIVKTWIAWDKLIYYSDQALDIKLNTAIDSLCSINLEKSLSDAERKFFLESNAFAQNNLGINNQIIGDHDQALLNYAKVLTINKELNDPMVNAKVLGNMANIFQKKGDLSRAIEYNMRTLAILEELDAKKNISLLYNNVGIIYDTQGDEEKAIEYYTKSLELKEELNDKRGMAITLTNLGGVYSTQNDLVRAQEEYNKSLKIYEEINDQRGLASCYQNLSIIYLKQEDYNKALEYSSKSLAMAEEMGVKETIALSLYNRSLILEKMGQKEEAFQSGKKSLAIAQEINSPERIMAASEFLYESYKYRGDYERSLEMHELFLASRDSLDSEKNQKEVIRQEYKYAYEKQAAADSVLAAQEAKVKDALLNAEIAENKQRRLQSYFLYGGLILAFFIGLFIYNRFKVSQKQKGIIEEQKEEVDFAYNQLEIKNQEVLDSITYAKRIQSAILPPDKLIKEKLSQSFVLYQPKDIVAGDFYWLNTQGNKVLVAAADCTGHGVPGAMVSVVCHNALNRSVREYNLGSPAAILNKTREIVVSEFEKSESDVQDGMDIALCSIEENTLTYAGAYNPLYLIRNNALIELKANRWPIGMSRRKGDFTEQQLEIEKGDMIYLFTDGYIDQFGGKEGKKLKKERFKQILLGIHSLELSVQKEKLSNEFAKWKGSQEQVDDICILGVRIS